MPSRTRKPEILKILRIRFQNLNSLNGIWEIDFSAPAYSENSLFAIIGPTGAGKSTLLDALCLALYGATPRLGKITKASNQIMSRHTGVCFAEVEFSTIRGRFRCHWSQHRSRQKSHGELQQPKHEITDASNNVLLESRIRNVASKIEEVTGMDFDRFTRSTLLAQGGFAAFLQASPDQRAPILEQITGTEIYSRLSIKVHELRLSELNRLHELEQSLSHINLLSSEDEEQLQKRIREKNGAAEKIKMQVTNLRTQLSRARQIAKLETDHAAYVTELEALYTKKKEHAELLDTLGPALAAREIEPLYQAVEKLITSQKEAAKENDLLAKKRKNLEETKQKTILAINEAEKSLQQAEASRKTGLEQIRAVEKIDHLIQNTRNSLQELTDNLNVQRKRHTKELSTLKTLEQNLLQAENEKNALETFLTEQAKDEKLLEEFAAIELSVQRVSELYLDLENMGKTKIAAKLAVGNKEQILRDLHTKKVAIQSQLLTASAGHDEIQKNIAEILQGSEFNDLQQKLFTTQTRQKSFQELTLFLEQINNLTKQLTQSNEQLLTLATESKERKGKLSEENRKRASKAQEVELLEKNLLLLVRIQTLEQDRLQLKDNVPCPLCGSKTHPYHHGNVPSPSEEEKKLQLAEQELQVLLEQIEKLKHQEIIAAERKSSLAEQIKKTETEKTLATKAAEELLSDLELPPLAEIHLERLQQESLQLNEDREKLFADRELLEKLNKKIGSIATRKEEFRVTLQALEKDILTAEHTLSSAQAELRKLLQEEKTLSASLTTLSDTLRQKLQVYGNFVVERKQLSPILVELGQRITLWKKRKKEESNLAPKLLSLHSECGHQKTLCTEREKQITNQDALCSVTLKQLSDFQQQRLTLFGEKNTTEEEERLEQAVINRRKIHGQLQVKSGDIDREITAVMTLQDRLQQDVIRMETDITTQQQLFLTTLTQSPFSNTEEFIAARRSPQELLQLQDLQRKLHEKETELTTLIKEKLSSLQVEKEKYLCRETAAEIEPLLMESEKQLETLQEESVTAKEQLKRNSLDKEKSATQLMAIATQKKKVSSWNTLHMLIGSADGKKFRNFAQGLTFELMVHHANNHLRKMSDRYILTRDSIHPLDLNVIDTYQADEVRSTKNLSGGESFLVSLALSLGLSKMASHNVRVDSLFLDEGFGTLDEDALESALETLAQLRDENKLIGIISHVAALKERIPVQIEIIPGSRGKSTISGPGVSRGV